MTDETPKTNEPERAPNAPSPSGTQPSPAPAVTGGRLEYSDKPSDASKTQDKGDASSSAPVKPPSKPIDQQGKPSPLKLVTPKVNEAEGQARPEPDKNLPAKTPDAKPAVAPNATPNAV